MPARFLQRHLDIFIAFALLIGSSALSIFTYQALQSTIERQQSLLHELRPGVRYYQIHSANGCLGNIILQFIQEAGSKLRADSLLFLKLNDREITLSLTGEANFNPLQQLTTSSLEITGPEAKLLVESRRVHPLLVSGQLTLPKDSWKKSLTLPGPVILEEQTNGSFSLVYPHERPQTTQAAAGFLKPLFTQYQLRVKERPRMCRRSEIVALDISQATRSWQAFLQRFS